MTKWEIGQELIAISDFIGDRRVEIAETIPQLSRELYKIQQQVGDLFNEYNNHDFGIIDSTMPYRVRKKL